MTFVHFEKHKYSHLGHFCACAKFCAVNTFSKCLICKELLVLFMASIEKYIRIRLQAHNVYTALFQRCMTARTVL